MLSLAWGNCVWRGLAELRSTQLGLARLGLAWLGAIVLGDKGYYSGSTDLSIVDGYVYVRCNRKLGASGILTLGVVASPQTTESSATVDALHV